MTNPFDPPRKQAFDDAELALAIESAKDALAAMDMLEQQAKLRAEDAQAYVAWVRQMESLGTDEAKTALSAARRTQAGLPAKTEEEVAEVVRRFEAFQIRTQGQLLALLDSIEPIDWQDITPEAVKQCMEIQADLKQMLLRENTNV